MNISDKRPTDLLSNRPIIKVCGLRREQDIRACINLGVDLLGFILYPKSPRNIRPKDIPDLRNAPVRKVGVFVDQDADTTAAIMEEAGLHLAQLHGGQSVQTCKGIGPSRVIKVLWPMRYKNRDELRRDMDLFAPVCAAFLLDAGMATGGHGASLDFQDLQHVDCPRPWFLAGGLGTENIHAALACHPNGIDLNSGIESAPGVKDAKKIKQVMEKIHKA